MTREQLKQELRSIHKEKGIRYSWFTDKLGVHRNNLSYFLNGKREISNNLADGLEKLINQINH